METRAITEDDIPACQEIFNASFDELHRRLGIQEEPADADWLRPILLHFLQTDPLGTRIALDDGSPVAFASGVQRDRYWFLSFLFVLPEWQSKGVGKQLLRELLPSGLDVVRATVVESFQSVATGLYASVGITPRAIKYWLSDIGRPERLLSLPSDLRKTELARADTDDVEALDRKMLGFTRSADHGWWGATAKWAYRKGDDLVAYAYVDDTYIGPVLARDEGTLCAVIADLARTSSDPAKVVVNLCGDAGAAFRMLTSAGARIDSSAPYRLVYCSDASSLPPSYVHHSDWLP